MTVIEYISLIITDLSACVLQWFESDIGIVFCGIFAVVFVFRLFLIIFRERG